MEIPSAGVWQICMEYSLAEPTWPSKTDQEFGEAEVSVTFSSNPAVLPREDACYWCPRWPPTEKEGIGMPLCLGTGNKRDSLRLLDGGFMWTTTQSMDSSP